MGLEKIDPETTDALQERYVFLSGAIPSLEAQFADLQTQVAKAQSDYAAASGLTNAIQIEKEAELEEKERKLGFSEQLLNEKEAALNVKEQELIAMKNSIDTAHTDLNALIAQHDERRVEALKLRDELKAAQANLDSDKVELEKAKTDFESYKNSTLQDIVDKQSAMDKKISDLKIQADNLVTVVQTYEAKSAALDAQRVALESQTQLVESKLADINLVVQSLQAQSAASDKKTTELQERSDFLDSKELNLKAIKMGQDKREAMLRELTNNAGIKVKDVVL